MQKFAPQRLLTHVQKGQELKLSADGKTYVDINTGWKYPTTVLEFVRSVTENGTSVQLKYGRPYISKTGEKKSYLTDLPSHIIINSVSKAPVDVYPATSYTDYTVGCKLSDVKNSPLKRNASPYYGNVDITIVKYRYR